MRYFSLFFILFGFLKILVPFTASANDREQYILIPYHQAQGLMPSYINHMSTDSLGQLQLATYGSGILSFDGNTFSPLGETTLAKHPIIRKLWLNKTLYYFITENELYEWNRNTDSLRVLFKGNSPILSFSETVQGQLLISNYSGNTLVLAQTGQIHEDHFYPADQAILDYQKISVSQGIYITADNKLVLEETGKPHRLLFIEKNDFFRSLIIHKDFLGIFGAEYFFTFDKKTFELKKKHKIPGNINITTTLLDGDKIWVGSQEGLFLLENGEFIPVNTTPNLERIAISSLVKTFDGTLWISTYGSGIYKLYDTQISKLLYKGEGVGNVHSITGINEENNSFLVTAAKGVFLIEGQQIREVDIPESSPSGQYFSGIQDSRGNIWIGGEGFLLRKRKNEADFSLMVHPVLENNIITSIMPWRDSVYIGTRKGLYLFDKELVLLKKFNENSSLKPRNISHITVIAADKIIFGNSFDLFETDGKTIRTFEIPGIGGKILSFEKIGEHRYWLGSSTGQAYLFDFKKNLVQKKLQIRHGKNIYSISVMQDSSIITGSEMGIERHYHDGKALLYDDRIRFSEVNYNSIAHSSDGNILVGTTEGLYKVASGYSFKPKNFPLLDFVSINQVQVSIRELIRENKPLTLSHNQNNLSFNFNLINYNFSENIRVRYRLDGFEESWGPFGNPGPIQYTNLPPGEYTIFTNIQYGQGDEVSYALPLKIFIRNPFWFHPAVMIGMLVFAFSSVYFGYVWFQRKTIRRNKKLSKMVEDRTREINEINRNLEEIIQVRTRDLHLKNDELMQTIHQKNKFQRYVKLIFSNTKDIFCMVTDKFEIIIISDSVDDLLGISGRQLIKCHISVLLAEKHTTAQMMAYIQQLPDQPMGLILPVLHKKTGEVVLIEILAKKITGAQPEEELGYVLNLRDVTEREYLKQELKVVYKNIHRDFHDEVGNKLAKIIALVSVMKIQFDEQPNGDNLIAKVESTAKHLYRDTRDFVWSLDQENNNLEDLSLQLRDFGENLFDGSSISFNCDLVIRENLRLKPNLVRDILLIVKEMMTNVLKHSNANQIHLIIKQSGKHMVFLVKDDGIGLCAKVNGKGNGLKNIDFRISRCKGILILKSKKGTLMGLRIGTEPILQKV